MSLLSKLSQATFSALKFLDETVSLPRGLSQSLDFRNSWESFLKPDIATTSSQSGSLWIHGASVGELEDLANYYLDKDLLEKSGYSFDRLVLTSSSVSAASFLEKLRARHPLRYAGPLPPEKPPALKRFFEQMSPDLLVLSHSDLWPVCMDIAQSQHLSRGIIWLPSHKNASQSLFKHIFHPEKLKYVGVRNSEDQEEITHRLAHESFQPTFRTLGNPRLDRIFKRIDLQSQKDEHALLEHACSPNTEKRSLLLGSAWLEDAQILAESFAGLTDSERNQWQVVVLPHDTSDIHLVASIQNKLPFAKILSVQGILLESYQSFDLAMVGGGYKTGLHNILEPLAWGVPTTCGPDLKQQPDAPFWVQQQALRSITYSDELRECLRIIMCSEDARPWREKSAEAAEFLRTQLGASARLSALVKEASFDE